jgi:hypothetical protein
MKCNEVISLLRSHTDLSYPTLVVVITFDMVCVIVTAPQYHAPLKISPKNSIQNLSFEVYI